MHYPFKTILNPLQQYFAHNVTTQGLQLSIAQPSFSKMTTNKDIGNLTVKENFVKKMQITEEIKDSLNYDIQTKNRKLNLAMNSKTFEHYLQKTQGLGKRRKLRITINKVYLITQMKLNIE